MTLLHANIYDAAGNRLGEGPLTNIVSASVTHVLDGAGSINITVPLTDERAAKLIASERRVRLFAQAQDVVREVGSGILRKIRIDASVPALQLVASGPDDIDELKRENTLLARIYNTQTVSQVAQDLAALAGWSVTGGASTLISARYDGASVFQALSELTRQQGLHFRVSASKTLEIGAFGSLTPLRITNVRTLHRDLYRADDIAIIEKLALVQDSEAVCNWLLPVGQGEGETSLTLAKSTRTSPYPIKTTTINGKTQYYLEDTGSVALYGKMAKTLKFSQIGAVSNSDADLENAANALYDTAAFYLERNAQRLDTYSCTVRKVNRTLRPGDKVWLTFRGVAEQNGKPFTLVDVDAPFWIMRATERFGVSGTSVDLELASVDRQATDAAQLLVGLLEQVEINNLRVQTYQNRSTFVYRRELDSTHTATCPIELSDATTALNRCKVRVVTRPFRSTAAAAASGGGATSSAGGGQTSSAGGDHRHKMFMRTGQTTITSPFTAQLYSCKTALDGSSGSTAFFPGPQDDLFTQDASGSHTHDITDHTHTVPDHTHPIDYGIADDTDVPLTLSLYVDGNDVSADLGGPWAGTGGIDELVDITTYLANAPGGLRTAHEIELRCGGGQGEAEFTVEVVETVQAIISS